MISPACFEFRFPEEATPPQQRLRGPGPGFTPGFDVQQELVDINSSLLELLTESASAPQHLAVALPRRVRLAGGEAPPGRSKELKLFFQGGTPGSTFGGGLEVLELSPDSEEIRFLLWALVVALACCLYAPELDIQ